MHELVIFETTKLVFIVFGCYCDLRWILGKLFEFSIVLIAILIAIITLKLAIWRLMGKLSEI